MRPSDAGCPGFGRRSLGLNPLSRRLCLGLFFVLAGCGREAPQVDGVDLVQMFPLAHARHEIGELAPGDPDAGPAFTSGWSGAGSTWWGVGDRSVLTFYVSDPREVVLAFRCAPFQFPGAPPQEMVVSVNGREIGRLVLSPGPEDYRLEIPGQALASGENHLVFGYSYSKRPEEVLPGPRDRRELAVAWQSLRLLGLGAPGAPYARSVLQEPTLTLPFGTEVAYFFRVRPGAALAVDGLIPLGRSAGGGALPALEAVVRFLRADGETVEAIHRLELDLPEAPGRLDLGAAADDVAEISLRAVNRDDGPARSAGLRLLAPRLELPPGASPGERTAAAPELPIRRRPNVVVYLIDTLRADHLGVYGYPRPVSPRIDALASEGTVFSRASAPTSWTRPSIVSLFTGLHPQTHGVNGTHDGLAEGPATLAELLRSLGYSTVGFTTNGNVHPKFGLGRGFDRYEHLSGGGRKGEPYRSSRVINRAVERWLDQRDGAPFFLFLHTIDPHGPYRAEPPWDRSFASGVADPSVGAVSTLQRLNSGKLPVSGQLRQDLIDLYDAEIAANDHYFGALVEMLEEHGLYEESMIVVLSDHGEEFGDHGRWTHGITLFEEQLHVPLIVKWPGAWQRGTVVSERVGLIDLAPTILSLAGADPLPESLQGRSLIPLLQGGGEDRPDLIHRPTFAYLDKDKRKIQSVAVGRYKLIHYLAYDRPRAPIELYDLELDRGEQVSRAGELSIPAGFLGALLRATELFWPRAEGRSEVEIDEELRGRLEALGYLQ